MQVSSDLLERWTALQRDQAARAIFDDDHGLAVNFEASSPTGRDSWTTAAHDYDDPVAAHIASSSICIDGLTRIAGVDVGYDALDSTRAIVVLAILAFPSLEILHTFMREIRPTAPYIPTFLSMRELEHVQAIYDHAVSSIPTEDIPGVVFVDGYGRWHARQAGLATALGVTRGIVTVGVGKEYQPLRLDPDGRAPIEDLCGAHRTRRESNDDHFRSRQKLFKQFANARLATTGDFIGVPLHRGGPLVGAAVWTAPKGKVRPSWAYVSPGHRIGLASSIALVLRCCIRPGVKVPEPIIVADRLGRDELARRRALSVVDQAGQQ